MLKRHKKENQLNFEVKRPSYLIPHWIEELWTNISKPRTIKNFNIYKLQLLVF